MLLVLPLLGLALRPPPAITLNPPRTAPAAAFVGAEQPPAGRGITRKEPHEDPMRLARSLRPPTLVAFDSRSAGTPARSRDRAPARGAAATLTHRSDSGDASRPVVAAVA
jgi:hypothetical protein